MAHTGHQGRISQATPGKAEGERNLSEQSDSSTGSPPEQMDPAALANFEQEVVHSERRDDVKPTPTSAPNLTTRSGTC